MPVHWDTVDDMWAEVESLADSYGYAEPPVAGSTCSTLEILDGDEVTRWPLSVYEVWCSMCCVRGVRVKNFRAK